MVKKILKYLGFLILILIIVYFLGPKAAPSNLSPKLPIISDNLSDINNLVLKQNQDENIREGNHSRIIWAKAS